ncbi:MAG: AMP-binding protein, partial [Clostridia bacterium]
MNLLKKFLNNTDIDNYEDFRKLELNVPKDFNFGFDIVDEYARLCPQKRALVWCNASGEEKIFSFKDISQLSNQTAQLFVDLGLKKGDYIMTMLNRRWEYWVIAVACHKMGITIVPATHLLTPKDIYYRCNSAEIKLLIATSELDVIEHIEMALPKCTTLKECLFTLPTIGFRSFDELIKDKSTTFPEGMPRTKSSDTLLCYFTSGTTGMPKMVQHDFEYPLAHIITAYFWQQVVDDGLHLTMAETGWAKASWGRIYGQWIAGTALFVYDYHGRFTPTDILPFIGKYGI